MSLSLTWTLIWLAVWTVLVLLLGAFFVKLVRDHDWWDE